MTKLAQRYLPVAYSKRGIAGRLGIRPHSVAIVDKAWSGDQPGDGIEVANTTAITEGGGEPPKVRWLNDEQKTLGGFGIGDQVVMVGPITPKFPGGGTDLSVLTGAELSNGEAHYLKITGPMHPNGAFYRVMEVQAQKALRFMIRAKAVSAST
jgi:hypothetical protein